MPRRLFYFLLFLAASAAGQDCTQTVPVRVVDRNTGAPIEPLTADMVTARMGQTSLPISAQARLRAGRIVVLIDESGSMNHIESSPSSSYQKYALGTVKQTLSNLMTALPPGVSVEYGQFSDRSALGSTFVSAPEEVRKSIDEVIARFGKSGYGPTAMRDALHEALMHFGTAQPGDTVLLLTDGVDSQSKLAAKTLQQEFRAAHARLLTMLVSGSSETPEEVGSRGSLQDLVEKTGGASLAIDIGNPSWANKKENPRNVETVRRFWTEWVLSTDVLQVQVPGTLTKETKWTLSVNRAADARLKHAVVIYPTRLSPCAVPTVSAH